MIPYLYDFLYIIPLSLASMIFGCTYSGAEEIAWSRHAVTLVAAVILVCLRQMENRGKLILSGTVTIVLAGVILVQRNEERVAFLLENRWVLQMILLALTAFLIGRLIIGFRRVRLAMAPVLAGVLCFTMVQGYKPPSIGVACLLFVLLLTGAEEIQLHWEKRGDTDARKHLVYIAPFLLIGLLTVAVVPAPEKPYDWQFAKVLWERARDGFTALVETLFTGGTEDYESALIGFSENGRLAGDVKANPKQVMEVIYNQGAGANIYMVGKVFDTFDGREWTAKNESEADERTLDTLETLYAVTAYDEAHPEDYVRPVAIDVRFLRFRTKYMFAPLKTLERACDSDKLMSYEKGGNLLFSKTVGNKTSYDIKYYRMNEGHTAFAEFLEAERVDNKETWNKVAGEKYSYEDLLAHRDRIYQYYLPQTSISSEMQAYLQNVTAAAHSDVQKLKAIEKHLQELTYSDTPGALSEQIADAGDYLDYFIFENPYGYCSHFSTAFVLMARAEGIPARYVQGYRIPVEQNGRTTITSDMAHAWPEAYIEGVGWIAFEPTPGYKRVTSWKTYAQKQEEMEAAGMLPGTTPTPEDPQSTPNDMLKEEEGKTQGVRWYMIAVPAVLCLLFLTAAVICDIIIRRKRYEELDDAGKLRRLCKNNMSLLRILGVSLLPGETLEEFEKRAEEQVPGEALSFIRCYESILYAEESGNEAMRKQAEEANEKLLYLVQEKKGFWFRIILELFSGKSVDNTNPK
ncbi:MAG: transglutaminase domain-containing protein [Lachnospiraceae bacterium]|nr:transglutaminase domain-containing protein [Lachnospiraceae bacterium]